MLVDIFLEKRDLQGWCGIGEALQLMAQSNRANEQWRLWKGIELGTIHIAAFCTHPFPYHIRHILELFGIGGENAGEQQEVTKVNIWNTQLISGREISTI